MLDSEKMLERMKKKHREGGKFVGFGSAGVAREMETKCAVSMLRCRTGYCKERNNNLGSLEHCDGESGVRT